MKVYKLQKQQLIQGSIEQVWNFFSNPENLAKITPPSMKFQVTSGKLPNGTYAGQIITYKVSPLFGIPLFWMTEITHVKELQLFVDEQRFGPYKFWHHQHHFSMQKDGVLMTDIVHYALPLHFAGRLAHSLFIKRQLQDIFDYRFRVVEQVFSNNATQHFNP
ncbi:MAG: SRPBCC family protein [Flavipsychrobacter sp.]